MTLYNDRFYDMVNAAAGPSAAVIAPLIMELVNPRTVIDVGCGEGTWAAAFEALGAAVRGVDGHHVDASRVLINDFVARDLQTQSFNDLGRFDLAVCLEVAEHLTEQRARSFIDELSDLAPTLLFSAAIPGQGGVGHHNERWPSYWVQHLREAGYRVSGALRYIIWDDVRVEGWYRQNLLLATMVPPIMEELNELAVRAIHNPLDLVHPVVFQHTHFRNQRS